jgi:hypothetical protein
MARSHVRLSTVSDLRDLRILKPWCFPSLGYSRSSGVASATLLARIGPRTMEQLESQLAAAEVVLDQAVLDRIDKTVPPGSTIIR